MAQGRGGTWSPDDVILFAPNINDVLHRVPAAGGVPAPVGKLDEQRRETSHRWPQFLPDGRRFVTFVRSAEARHMGVYLGSLDSDERTMLLQTDAGATWAEPGFLLALRDETLVAYAFDPDRKTLGGEPRPLVERLGHSPDFNYAAFSVSGTGVLLYGAATMAPRTQLTWVDRKGQILGAAGSAGEFSNPALSPDRRRLAVARFDPRAGARDIWLFDAATGAGTRFTFDARDDAEPMWSPDGRVVVFRSNRDGHGNLYKKVATGAGGEDQLFQSTTGIFPTDWSRDGKLLAYQSPGAKSGWNLWFLNLENRTPQPFLQSPFNEMHARWAPGGKWIAYMSDESGNREIWVQAFPPTGGKWQVSTQGGSEPQWREDAAELYYVSRERKLMAVPVKPGESFESGDPAALFDVRTPIVTAPFGSSYAVSPDGQRFLVNALAEDSIPIPINAILQWPSLVRP